MSRPQPSYTLITNKQSLIHLAEKLKKESVIGVDLEADSMFHYQEKVCLIQISTPFRNFIIDPLGLEDLSSIAPIFSDVRVRKIFHGADYDIRSLYRDFGIEVNNLFDTQIAASFLGVTELGLAALLKNRLGVELDKKYQRRDWSKRPLPPAMLAYAIHDSCYLIELNRILENELRNKKRLLWVKEECERLSQVRPLPPSNNPFFMKFKNARKLDARSLAVLESILKLRDEIARRRDRPPFKIFSNEAIMGIALNKPLVLKDLEQIKGLSTSQIQMMGHSILKRVEASLALPKNKLPAFPKKTRQQKSSTASEKTNKLKFWRERRAKDFGIDPGLLCTNAQIELLARAFPKNRKDLESVDILRQWQKRLYGQEILDLLKPNHPTS